MSDPHPNQPARATEPQASAAETEPANPVSNATADAASSAPMQPAPVDAARGDSAAEEALDDHDPSTGDTAATGFAAMGLAPPIARAVAELGYEVPTSIQSSCIPPLLEGRDLLARPRPVPARRRPLPCRC